MQCSSTEVRNRSVGSLASIAFTRYICRVQANQEAGPWSLTHCAGGVGAAVERGRALQPPRPDRRSEARCYGSHQQAAQDFARHVDQ